MEERHIAVAEEDAGRRLDSYLSEQLAGFSRSFLRKMIREERALVNGLTVKASHIVKAGDEIALSLSQHTEPDILPLDIPLAALYEDSDVIVVNKPQGMVVHPACGHYQDTLVNALMAHCRGSLSGINGVMRPGIVHRIDKDTSGSLIICKNDFSHEHIAAQLKAHSLLRRYRAVCHGLPTQDEYRIDAPIGRHPTQRKRMAINPKNGKEAVTHVRVLERFSQPSHMGQAAYVECRLETGRTHQIRVHLASIGHPLLGDTVYGPGKNTYGLKGQALHAFFLGFTHPQSGEWIETEAELPEYFVQLLKKLRQ